MSSFAHRLSVTVLVCVLGCLGHLFADEDVINSSGSDELKSDTHKSVVNHMRKILEQQTIVAKQQRDQTTNAINIDIGRDASLASNMSQVTGTITNSLQNFRMP